MEVEQTREFEKDAKRITAKTKQRIDDIVKLLSKSAELGEELHYMKGVYSIRIENKRLIYQILKKENRVILLMFKSREDVYTYLKG